MNFFKALNERLQKGSAYIKQRLNKSFIGKEHGIEDTQEDKSKKGHLSAERVNHSEKATLKDFLKDLTKSDSKGRDLLKKLTEVSRSKQPKQQEQTFRPDVVGKADDMVKKVVEPIKEVKFEGTPIISGPLKPGKTQAVKPAVEAAELVLTPTQDRFERAQKQRNEAIWELRNRLEDYEVEIGDRNGFLEKDSIPWEVISRNETELHNRMKEYYGIIKDAEDYVRERLVNGYDNFLNMLTGTILPDMNEGFIDMIKEEFKNADLHTKSKFLRNWWKELREMYDDLKKGSETTFGLANQKVIADAMLSDIRGEGYENTWLV